MCIRDSPIRRLFLGGTNETLAQFREMLPKQLQSCLAGSFAVDKDMGETEVRRRALELLRQANARRRTSVSPMSCLLYTSDAADERSSVDLGGRRHLKKKTHNESNTTIYDNT